MTPRKPFTKRATQKFLDQAFTDRVSWTAARVLLERVTADPAYETLSADLQLGIQRFLERHPTPLKKESE